ncbi:MAG: enolase C-terminal domain-like protein [Polyangiaceae bacterium]
MKVAPAGVSRFRIEGRAAREGLLLRLCDEDGRESWGEAAPISGWSTETLEEAERALLAVCARAAKGDVGAGRGELGIDEGRAPVDAVGAALAPFAESLRGSPSARFALETAMLDLLARRRGEDVAASLCAGAAGPADSGVGAGGRTGGSADSGPAAWIETGTLLSGAGEGEAFVARGLAALARGFRVLKVKLSAEDDGALVREIEGLSALRRAAPDFELRLDPNGRWSVEDARRRLAMLAPLGPAFVEQPVPREALSALGKCAVPWAADESLASAVLPEGLSREHGCSAFVLKPAALGILRARELAALAASRGLAVVVTHFLDGPVGLSAACETALSLARGPAMMPVAACGLDPHSGVTALPRGWLPHHAVPGCVQRTSMRGLGLPAELDAALCERRAPKLPLSTTR